MHCAASTGAPCNTIGCSLPVVDADVRVPVSVLVSVLVLVLVSVLVPVVACDATFEAKTSTHAQASRICCSALIALTRVAQNGNDSLAGSHR